MSPRILGLACVVPLLLCSLLMSQDKEPRRLALLIGINEYSAGSGVRKLSWAEADVEEMAKLLEDGKYRVTLLTGKDATAKRCAEEIDKIKAMKLNDTDTVLVGLAGHGQLFRVKDRDVSFFVPHDGVPKAGRLDSLLSLDELVAELQDSGAGKRFLLIDACRDVAGRGVRGESEVTFSVKSGTGVLFSCKEGEMAQEPDEFRHGLFFYHVLQRLRESNGKLKWGRLVADVVEKVPEAMPKQLAEKGAKQHPDDLSKGVAGEVVFEGKTGAQRKPGEVVEVALGKGVKMKFCWIPPGEAQLGSPKAERLAVLKQIDKTEEPDWLQSEAEEVRGKYTSKGFWLGKYPVTQEEWQTLMDENPSYFVPSQERIKKADTTDTSRFPVEQVSWDDCQKYLKNLNGKELPAALGKGSFVLPHEDEWEYACRGGKGNRRPFYFGDELNGKQANCDGNYPYGTTTKGAYLERPVAVDGKEQEGYEKEAPHPWGLCHMHGNVYQWCENLYRKDARVVRGGSWSYLSRSCRAAYRYRSAPSDCHFDVGVRVAFRLD